VDVAKFSWVILSAAVAAFELLNFSGFCYSQFRYYSRSEMIDIAARYQIERRSSDEKHDRSLDQFHQENPNCCSLYAWGHDFESSIVFRVVGFYRATAEIWYRVSDPDARYPFYRAYISMNACGRVVGYRGIQEASGPKLF
jgi:hypothetical protein